MSTHSAMLRDLHDCTLQSIHFVVTNNQHATDTIKEAEFSKTPRKKENITKSQSNKKHGLILKTDT